MTLDPVVKDLLERVEQELDPYTVRHQLAVARLSIEIGRAFDLSLDRMLALQMGAAIHDLGKAAVPLDVLHKQERLTAEEWLLIKAHPEVGAELARDFECSDSVVEMVRQHHERVDGSGYPHGISGADILLEARIIAVADVFEAIACTRPYRVGLGVEESLTVVRAGRAAQFDADVVDALDDVIGSGFDIDADGSGDGPAISP